MAKAIRRIGVTAALLVMALAWSTAATAGPVVEGEDILVSKHSAGQTVLIGMQRFSVSATTDIRDESGREGMRVIIELRKDAASQIVLNRLYKHTAMQTTFGANMVALVDMQPRQLGLREMLQYFVAHRRDIVLRRTQFELSEAERRAHIVEGLLKALLADIDVMYSYARQRGITLPPDLLKDISELMVRTKSRQEESQ